VYPLSTLSVASTWPFGLVCYRRPVAVQGEIVVYPAAYPCEAPQAAGYEPMLGGSHSRGGHARSGMTFHGVRPLQPGDPPRAIHWKSSAKGEGLMVKEFEEELAGRVGIVVGCDVPEGAAGRALLDRTARAAASLLYAALDRGHQVEYVDLAALERHSVPPFSDGASVLEALARLHAEPRAPELERLDRAVAALSPRGSLCFVLPRLTPAVRDWLARPSLRRRKLTLVLPESAHPPELPAGVALRTYTADSLAAAGGAA
jgi:uncharacterized protein (DUF58 family)